MRKRTIGLTLCVILALVVGWQVVALAGPVGSASGFEDDDGNLADDAATGIDWNSFKPTTWTGTAPYRESDKTALGWTFKGIEDDKKSSKDTAFAGGTKQDDDCASVIGASAPNKDDLKRIYLASSTGSNGHTYLDLAWVRIPLNTTSSSAHVGFEFNQGTTPCGAASDGLVKRTAGDMLIVYDFEGGGGDPVLTLRRWVTSGACEVSSDTAPCWGTATNLTAGGFAEAKVNTSGSVTDQIAPNPPDTLGKSEFGEAGIDLTGAGVFTAGTCQSFGTAYGVSRSSGSSGTAQMKDLAGPADFNLSNCGTVKIIKNTDPRGVDQNFDFTSNLAGTCTADTTPSSFTLNDKDNTANTETCTDVPAGSYTVTEGADPTGFALKSLSCTPASGTSSGTQDATNPKKANITIAGNGTVTCTYVNERQLGALKILKQSTKTGNPLVSSAGAVFSYDGSSVTDNGTGDEDPDVGEVCVSGLTLGDYTVNETSPPPGYGDADASEADQTATVTSGTNCGANLPSGSAVATFTNPPLADIQVNFRDGGSGETSAIISCAPLTPDSTTPPTGWDTSGTFLDLDPGNYTCTVNIDP